MKIQTRIFEQNSVLHQANEKGKGEREQVDLEREMRRETKEMRRGTKEQWKTFYAEPVAKRHHEVSGSLALLL